MFKIVGRRYEGVWRLCLAVVISSTLVTASCSQKNVNGLVPTTLNRGLNGSPETLDPHQFKSSQSGDILRDIGEGLMSYSDDGSLVGGIAEAWTVSDDGLQYDFRLRPDAKWSNGDSVLSTDIQFGLQRLVTPETASPSAKFVSMIDNANEIIAGNMSPDLLGVAAVGPHSITITLESATPYFLQLLTHPSTFPIHRASLEEHGRAFVRPGHFVSNGAYKLFSRSMGSSIELARNEFYWDNEHTWFDSVVYHVMSEAAEILRFRAGGLDVTNNVNVDSFAQMKNERPDELKVSPALNIYYYGFNLTKPFLRDNPKLRQALSMAIDRERLTNAVTGRGEAPAYGWVPPGIDNYLSQELDYAHLTQQERDLQAKLLFEESGYGPDRPLEIEIRYNTLGGHEKVALVIGEMWRETLGVEATLVNEEFKVLLSNIQAMDQTEVFRLSWSGDYNDARTFLQLVESNNPQNQTAYSNSEVDELLRLASVETDLDKRRGYLEAAERLALADHPVIPLYFYVTKHLVGIDIAGWNPSPLDYHYSKYLSRRDD